MPQTEHSYYARRWLNRPGFHAGAHVIASVDRQALYGNLVITDCSRVIRLEFDAYTPESRRNSLHKLDTLATTIAEMRAALAAAKSGRRPSR